jgi:hypothetical protein
LAPLTLDIGAPGPASVVRLVDARGTPVCRAVAAIARPEGPLAALLWPAEFTSDGAGVLHIPPLEAGTHKFRIRGAAEEELLVIPSLSDHGAKPIERRVVMASDKCQ